MEKNEYFENLLKNFKMTDPNLTEAESYMCRAYIRSITRNHDLIVLTDSICDSLLEDVFKIIIKSGITGFIYSGDSFDSIEILAAMLDFGFTVVGSINAVYGIENYRNVYRGVVMKVN